MDENYSALILGKPLGTDPSVVTDEIRSHFDLEPILKIGEIAVPSKSSVFDVKPTL